MVRAVDLDFVSAPVEDRSDRFLAGGMVSGDVEQVVGGTGLQASKLVDQDSQVVSERNALIMSTSTTSGRELHHWENLQM